MQGNDEKHIVLVFDEMKIKNDLVYNKHTSRIIGYVSLGSMEQQLLLLEEEKIGVASHVATHMLQFMVQAISAHLNYPVAHFATSTCTAEQLYAMVWDVIARLESIKMKVIIVTADGASVNRKCFCMHADPAGGIVANGKVYKTTNVYAPDREVYFMSDVPHLIKTQNCWKSLDLVVLS